MDSWVVDSVDFVASDFCFGVEDSLVLFFAVVVVESACAKFL